MDPSERDDGMSAFGWRPIFSYGEQIVGDEIELFIWRSLIVRNILPQSTKVLRIIEAYRVARSMVTEPGPCYWALSREYWKEPQHLLGKLVVWTVMCEVWPARLAANVFTRAAFTPRWTLETNLGLLQTP